MESSHENVIYNPSQEEALSYMIWDDELLATYMYGGVRGGKSFLACKVAQAIAQIYPGSEGLLCRDTRVNMKQTTQKTFFDVDANGEAVTCRDFYSMKNWNETMGELTWHNGSRTCFWGLDTTEHIDRVKSTQWSYIIVEEANGVRFDIIEFLLYTRLSHPLGPGKMLLISNTDKGEDHLYRLFFNVHTCSHEKICTMCMGPCQFRRVHVSTLDNEKNLPDKYIKNIKKMAETRQDYARIYVHGEHVVVEGLIYPMYDERYNVIDIPIGYEWNETVETVYGYDHGFSGSPSCLLTAKVLPDGSIVFWDEYYAQGKTVGQMSQDFLGMGIKKVHCADPSIRNKNQDRDGKITSIQDLYNDHGVTMELADNDVDGRIEKMRDMISRDPEHVCSIPGIPQEGIKDMPRLYIARVGGKIRCPNLHNQIMQRVNKKDSRGNVSGKKYNPADGLDHALDPCFHPLTQVKTIDGIKNICDVTSGDYVETFGGYTKVLEAGITGIQKELTELITMEGRRILATSNHKFFVIGKGLVRLCDLQYLDKIIACPEEKSSNMVEEHSSDILIARSDRTGSIFQMGDIFSTESFTRINLVKSLRGCMYIIKTGILSIMPSTIWNSSMRSSTQECTTKIVQISNIDAESAERYSIINSVIPFSASPVVDRGTGIKKWWTMLKDHAFSALRNLYVIGTTKPDFVHAVAVVKTIGPIEEKSDVYCLHTEAGMFYANGILAKNCEYIVNARYRGKLQEIKEPEQGTQEWARKKAMDKFFTARQSGLKPVGERL